jgi:hypothetical protein
MSLFRCGQGIVNWLVSAWAEPSGSASSLSEDGEIGVGGDLLGEVSDDVAEIARS